MPSPLLNNKYLADREAKRRADRLAWENEGQPSAPRVPLSNEFPVESDPVAAAKAFLARPPITRYADELEAGREAKRRTTIAPAPVSLRGLTEAGLVGGSLGLELAPSMEENLPMAALGELKYANPLYRAALGLYGARQVVVPEADETRLQGVGNIALAALGPVAKYGGRAIKSGARFVKGVAGKAKAAQASRATTQTADAAYERTAGSVRGSGPRVAPQRPRPTPTAGDVLHDPAEQFADVGRRTKAAQPKYSNVRDYSATSTWNPKTARQDWAAGTMDTSEMSPTSLQALGRVVGEPVRANPLGTAGPRRGPVDLGSLTGDELARQRIMLGLLGK